MKPDKVEQTTINGLDWIFSDSDTKAAYVNLILNRSEKLSEDQLFRNLKMAILFLNYGDDYVKKLGYRIIVRYCNYSKDYRPLYDVALANKYIPVAKFIEDVHLKPENINTDFFKLFSSAYQDNFRDGNIYLSEGQVQLQRFSNGRTDDYVLVAPTSYGKSEIIIKRVLENIKKRVCILVPSKALLAQTKKRLLSNQELAKTAKRIITHPDMYRENDEQFVAVLTQERLLRLLQKFPKLKVDLLLLDEAHNLLSDNERTTLLTQVLLILKKRNKNTWFNFFTPFISDAQNLHTPYSNYSLAYKGTDEAIKTEKYFVCDLLIDRKTYLYDQFLNDFILTDKEPAKDCFDFVQKNKTSKNIIYANRPIHIEEIAMKIVPQTKIRITQELQEALEAIEDFLDKEYNLLKCIKNGVVYHHGGMPDVIRLYVESIFSQVPEMQFIVTNSTLLEGVNIPAERIFLFTTFVGRRTFSRSQFKNLIGRVCRFSEIFNRENGNLRMLEPEIYIIKGPKYIRATANPREFLKKHAKANLKTSDEVGNLLLVPNELLNEVQQNKVQESLEYLENIERNTVEDKKVEYVESQIAKLCFKNNVYDFKIKECEQQLVSNLKKVENEPLINDIGDLINTIFIVFIDQIDIIGDDISRLKNEASRKFYMKVLNWRTTGGAYKRMITEFIKYWKTIPDQVVFAGKTWGEIERPGYLRKNNEQPKLFYVDLNTKSDSQKVNLAIVRIKEEQDFVDNNLMKYVEILNDLELLNRTFYETIKYGTSDAKIICLLKNGFSIDLARCVVKDKYSQYLRIDIKKDEVYIQEGIITAMDAANENKILIFEIRYHIS